MSEKPSAPLHLYSGGIPERIAARERSWLHVLFEREQEQGKEERRRGRKTEERRRMKGRERGGGGRKDRGIRNRGATSWTNKDATSEQCWNGRFQMRSPPPKTRRAALPR